MASKARITSLTDINIVSGLNEKGKPFVTVTAVDSDGNRMVGQLDVAEVRSLALNHLEVAEAAEHDAMFARFLQEQLEQPLEAAATIIGQLRQYREPSDG